jgi:hypothetical protein
MKVENDVVCSTFLQGIRFDALPHNKFDQGIYHKNGEDGQPHPPRSNQQT